MWKNIYFIAIHSIALFFKTTILNIIMEEISKESYLVIKRDYFQTNANHLLSGVERIVKIISK